MDRTENATFLEDSVQRRKQSFPPIGPWENAMYLKSVNLFILGLFDGAFENELVFMTHVFGDGRFCREVNTYLPFQGA